MSGKGRVGGYTWWPSDYLADEHVRAMTYEQEGVYRACLDLAWLHGSIPADLPSLAKVLGKRMTAKRLAWLWPGIAPCWQERDGRLVNGRMERERADMEAFRAERVESGRRGGRASVQSRLGSTSATTSPQAHLNPPTPTPSPTPTPEELHAANAAAEPVESLGAWYGRRLKPVLYPAGTNTRDDENRDVHALKHQFAKVPREEIEAAVEGARAEVRAGRAGWVERTRQGDFTLRTLLADAVDGGISHFERFKAAGMRPKSKAERGGRPTALADLLKGGR